MDTPDNKMPEMIFAHMVARMADHGFGGCAWGTGEKYINQYLALANEESGEFYYSGEKVRALMAEYLEALVTQLREHGFIKGVNPALLLCLRGVSIEAVAQSSLDITRKELSEPAASGLDNATLGRIVDAIEYHYEGCNENEHEKNLAARDVLLAHLKPQGIIPEYE